ncbi:hypothetical protein Tco_1374433, partial [Tanacetum coccineum]
QTGRVTWKASRSRPPSNIKQPDWDKQIAYWLDDKNSARDLQNAQNWAKSKVFCQQGSQSLTDIQCGLETASQDTSDAVTIHPMTVSQECMTASARTT